MTKKNENATKTGGGRVYPQLIHRWRNDVENLWILWIRF